MKKFLLTIILTTTSSFIYAQYEFCDSLVVMGHYVPFDTSGVSSTREYIGKNWKVFSSFISDRNDLKQVPVWINSGQELFFASDSTEIRMRIEQKKIDAADFFYPKGNDEPFSTIINAPEEAPFGITSEDTLVNFIANLVVNGKTIPSTVFSDLLSPNLFETFFSVKPIQAYQSKCGQYLFLYVFGELRDDAMTTQQAFNFSYMAKLIFKISGEYVGRIVERGEKLNYFGFDKCPDFIGF